MPWIELHQNILRHPKLIRLSVRLSVKKQDALWHLLSLWLWALDYAERGDLSAFGAAEIANAAEWPGDPDKFLLDLQDSKWMDGMCLHDWMDYAGRLIEQREANKKRMRDARAKHVQNTTAPRVTLVGGLPNLTNQPDQPDQTELDMEGFDLARKAYPGAKAGLKPEFENFRKKHKAFREIIPLLLPAIEREKAHKKALVDAGQFCAEWKNFQTWINKSCWTTEFPKVEAKGANHGTNKQGSKPTRQEQLGAQARKLGALLRGIDGEGEGPDYQNVDGGESSPPGRTGMDGRPGQGMLAPLEVYPDELLGPSRG